MKKGGLESEVPKNRVFGWCRVLYGTQTGGLGGLGCQLEREDRLVQEWQEAGDGN